MEEYPRDCKVVVLGTTGVGKSCLAVRYKEGLFNPDVQSTIGASFMAKTAKVNGATIKFQIWDTAGAEKYRSLAPMYYRGASAAVLVYDITDKESFDLMKKWVLELEMQGPSNVVKVIAGNKADIPEGRNVEVAEAEAYAQSVGASFFETSAVTGQNVEQLFQDLGRRLPALGGAGGAAQNPGGAIKVGEGDGKKGGCPC